VKRALFLWISAVESFSASLGAGRLVQVFINNCALLGGNDTQILEVDF